MDFISKINTIFLFLENQSSGIVEVELLLEGYKSDLVEIQLELQSIIYHMEDSKEFINTLNTDLFKELSFSNRCNHLHGAFISYGLSVFKRS